MQRLSGLDKALMQARDAKRETGRSIVGQFVEMFRLRLDTGKLMPNEYFRFGLYDDGRFSPAAKQAFVGQWAKDIIYGANEGKWRAIGDDKLISYLVFAGLGLPHPKVLALYHPHRHFPARALRTSDALVAFLRDEATYPLFAKPVDGSSAASAYLLEAYSADADAVVLGDGRELPLADFAPECTRWGAGMLFQELVVPDPAVREVCGPRIATARLYVLNRSSGTRLHRAVLRMPTGGNMFDNFQGGASGNLLAALDEAGRIIRVLGRGDGRLVEVTHHPDTQQPLIGWQIPGWDALTSSCLEAAAAFPGLRIQAWDVAPAAGGPMFIEMNTRGDLDLIQLAHGRGIIDADWDEPRRGSGASGSPAR